VRGTVHHHRLEVLDAEGVPLAAAQRRMEGHQPGLDVHGADQRRQVRKAAQEFRRAADQPVVQQRQHAVGTRAAGDGQDAGHAGVGEQRVDVVGTLLRRAGHVAVARAQVGRLLRVRKPSAFSVSCVSS
jgi:hypothetical protein